MLTEDEISRLAVVCPNIRLCIIHDYEVVEKKEVRLPDTLENVVKCANPVCISNNEPMRSFFYVTDKVNGVMKCHYCNKEQKIDHAEFYKS
jgi:aspartate carbamoyltransferase regulatory subunit